MADRREGRDQRNLGNSRGLSQKDGGEMTAQEQRRRHGRPVHLLLDASAAPSLPSPQRAQRSRSQERGELS